MLKASTSMPLGILIGAISALVAVWLPAFFPSLSQKLFAMHLPFNIPLPSSLFPVLQPSSSAVPPTEEAEVEKNDAFVCKHHSYTTNIISADPLVIYLADFITPAEVEGLLAAGEGRFNPSNVQRSGHNEVYSSRTSTSAGLPRDDPVVQCVLSRARQFMGTFHSPERDDMGTAQLVRYVEGQKFDVHHDWFSVPQVARADPLRRPWNRIVSFFAILEDECDEGETWFPFIKAIEPQPPVPEFPKGVEVPKEALPPWREHPDGGLAFRPIAGNAVFWVNLHVNGTGDSRTMHAGLPVKGGRKTAMNIWPKKYFPKP